MPKLSAEALKARIAKLQQQLASAESNKEPKIKKVLALMKKLGLTLNDLRQGDAPKRRGRPPKSRAALIKPKTSRKKVAIKYRDDNGNTWTGRGKTPRWLLAAEKSGKSRDAFKI